jgi:dTDP-4-dehydrorhamnose 3,5-epimerase
LSIPICTKSGSDPVVKVIRTEIPDVLILEPKVFADERGFFLESYNKRTLRDATGIDVEFVQDNHSSSGRNVLRGLHYQVRQPQGKLVRVIAGEVFDVAVDLRRSSATFGKAVAARLDAASKRMVWIPPGFAHGFLVLSERAELFYKATDFYAPDYDRSLLWRDPALGVRWPLDGQPILSPKDVAAPPLSRAELYP